MSFDRTPRPSVDATAVLPLELLTYTLDYMPNEELMRAAAVVSKRWRTAASACSDYYLFFRLDTSRLKYGDDSIETWGFHMSCTAPQPLELVICDEQRAPDSIWCAPMFQRILELMDQNLPRVKRITCELDDERLPVVLAHLANGDIPLLRYLGVAGTDMDNIDVHLPAQLLDLNAPRLDEMFLQMITLGPTSSALFGKVQNLDLVACHFLPTAVMCGQFPSLRRLIVEGGVAVRPAGSLTRATAITTLEILHLAVEDLEEADFDPIDFSSVGYLNISGFPSIAPFLGRYARAELCTVYDKNPSMVALSWRDALIKLTLHSDGQSSESNAATASRSLVLGFSTDGDFQPEKTMIYITEPILVNLTTVELVHPTLCELLAMVPSLPQIVRIFTNLVGQKIADGFWPSESDLARCPALQELQLFSHAWSEELRKGKRHDFIFVSAVQLSGFCSELGLFRPNEEARTRLVLVGVEVILAAEGEDSPADYRDMFSLVEHKASTSCPGCCAIP